MSNIDNTDKESAQDDSRALPRGEETQSSQSSGPPGSASDSHVYHPYNLAELSAMIRSPTRGFYSGNSLLYSTSGFDMISVIARVGECTVNISIQVT